MRDNIWLKDRLGQLWNRHFPDIDVANTVIVRFGRPAKTRLGSIKFGRRTVDPNTYITITGYFRSDDVPDFVVDAVLAHELSHYAHGFFSPHERLHTHPHKYGIVNNELTQRGLGDILKLQTRWLKQHCRELVSRYA